MSRNLDKEAADAAVGNVPLVVRGVLWSPTRGVRLGDGKWSYGDPLFAASAPTVVRGEIDPATLGADVQFRQCWPDLPDDRASVNAVADAGLPRW